MLTGAQTGGQATAVHDYLLPCEAVFAAHASGGAITDEVEKLRDAYFERWFLTFSSVLGPVPEAADRHEPPPPEEADRMAARRFGLYFALCEDLES